MNFPQETPEQPVVPDPEPGSGPASVDPNPEPAGAPHGPGPSPTEPAKFFHWLRGLGIKRGSKRWVGGVCSGLADKWGIDPVIVRGLTVVLTLFFGVGLLAYGVAWALLPEPDGRIHIEEVGHGRWSAGMTGAAVATLLGLGGSGSGVFQDGNDGWFFWPILWIGGIVWLIYWALTRSKSTTPLRPPAQGTPSQPPWQSAAQPSGQWQDLPQQPLQYGQAFTPDPGHYVKHRPVKTTPRLGAAASILVWGMAAVVGAVILILDASGAIDLHGYQASVAAAAAAITAGIAIIVSGILGRTAGGLGTFAIIMLVCAALLGSTAHAGPIAVFNTVTWTPQSSNVAEAGRTVVMSNATFDLTGFDGGKPLSADVQIPLNAVMATVTIKVPNDIPVTVKSELAAAALTVDGQEGGGAVAQETTSVINPSATGHGLVITLQGVASNIDIQTVSVSP